MNKAMYQAYAIMKNAYGDMWRVNIYQYDSRIEAMKAGMKFKNEYTQNPVAEYIGIELKGK